MSSVGKQDNIFEDGNLSGLPFTFNQEVTEVFEDMILRSVPGYQTSLRLITQYTKNCLLYTSPSPRDLSTSRMPSSA